MMIWTLIVSNLSKVGMGIFGAIGLFLMGRNSKLASENNRLQQDAKASDKIIDIQKKVIDVAQNTAAADLDGNIARMQNDKL
jgi:hypothetical protein